MRFGVRLPRYDYEAGQNREAHRHPKIPVFIPTRSSPRLEERRKNGGEQQMLAIARALLCGPKRLMLDGLVEGLAPVVVDKIVAQVKKVREAGVPILRVERNLAVCAELADRHYIIELARIVHESSVADFVRDAETRNRYLGGGV